MGTMPEVTQAWIWALQWKKRMKKKCAPFVELRWLWWRSRSCRRLSKFKIWWGCRDHVLFRTIICIIFTSLCKKLVKLTWVFSRSFLMPCTSFSMHDGPCIENDVHGIEKLLLKTQASLTSFLQSEVKIIHIIVQNNTQTFMYIQFQSVLS